MKPWASSGSHSTPRLCTVTVADQSSDCAVKPAIRKFQNIPQGLKPDVRECLCGTAEAVPFQNAPMWAYHRQAGSSRIRLCSSSPRPPDSRSVLDAALREDAFLVGVLHFSHFGDGVCDGNERWVCVAAGEDDVHHFRARFERLDYLRRVEHAIADGVVDLVEDDHVPVAGEDGGARFGPCFFDEANVFGIGFRTADFDEAAAHLAENEIFAEGFGGVELAVVPGAFEELQHEDAHAVADCAQCCAHCGSGLALARAGVDEDQSFAGFGFGHALSLFFASCSMIRVAGEDGEGTVDLFAEYDAGEFVGEGHGAEGKPLRGAFAGVFRPAVGGTDGEDDELAALVALAAEPLGEGFRGHLLAALVEEDEHWCGAGAFALDGFPESVFGAKDRRVESGFGAAGEQRCDAIEVETGQVLEGVARACTDGGDPELHGD